jgi:fucose 4-O-acetylase-like acetyltransferase
MTARPRLAFIDFFKCAGIIVILYGHLAGWAPLADFPPIHSKQIGVALFLFASGYSLASERRPVRDVLFNRLFEVFLFGLALALIVSVAGAAVDGGWRPSNYLPFAAGINVLLNNFPANPTTWYVGTYVHVLVLWAVVLRRTRASLAMVAGAFAIEVFVRAVLLDRGGEFIAYMAVPNWLTVFVLGRYFGAHHIDRLPGRAWIWTTAAAVFTAVWLTGATRLPLVNDFPFYTTASRDVASLAARSLAISIVYAASVLVALGIFGSLAPPKAVTFIARNTLIVFLAHMPVYYALRHWMPDGTMPPAARSMLMMIVCLPGLAYVSERLRQARWLQAIRLRLAREVTGRDSDTAERALT